MCARKDALLRVWAFIIACRYTYYEWTGDRKARQPHLFTAADGTPILALAGLWDRWRDPVAGEDVLSCTIIVCPANAWMATYHDRMPVVLQPEDFDAWLNGTAGTELLQPAAVDALREWPVSRRVNRSGQDDDDPMLIRPETG
jgi:putative SOS response-associated peptidase YedK